MVNPVLSPILLYANSAVQFVNFYKQWDKFIERAIAFNRFTTIYKMQDDERAIHSKETLSSIEYGINTSVVAGPGS